MIAACMAGGSLGWAASNATTISGTNTNSTQADRTCTENTTLFLSGVAIYGNERSALFEVATGNHTMKRQVKEGGKICGYTLDRIENDRVSLKHGGEEVKVLLLRRGRIQALPANKKVERGKKVAERKVGKQKGNATPGVERYAPGEIDLTEHKEGVERGILKVLEMIQQSSEPMENESGK